MTLTRKAIVLGMLGLVFLVANVLVIANWLAEKGVIDWARHIRTEYFTGTAITIIVALLILLASPQRGDNSGFRRCPVCDKHLASGVKYCGECGSKV